MTQTVYAIVVFTITSTCWGLGLLAGYYVGKRKVMTRGEAARIMAKASWRNRG